MRGAIGERFGDHVLLAAAFMIEDAQLDELVDKLETAITAAI